MNHGKEEEKEAQVQEGLDRRCFLKGSFTLVGGMVMAIEASKLVHPDMLFGAEAAKLKPEDMMKYLYAVREGCTGCRSCEYACSMYHNKGVVRPSVSAIHVKKFKHVVDIPQICWHCEDAPCVKSCPTTPQAIIKDKETNTVKYIDDKTCLGAKCNKCIEACPSGFLRRHPDTGKPIFCDLCGGDPQCVKACQSQATDTAPVLSTAKKAFGVNLAYRNVSTKDAADGLLQTLFYPNTDGGRR